MRLEDADLQAGRSRGLLQQLAAREPLRELAVFRALQLGDMLCAVPALRALRAALPQTRITLIGLPWAQQFAQRFHAVIDDFIAFPGHPGLPEQPVCAEAVPGFYEMVRARRFDLALQLHGSGRTSNPIVHEFGAKVTAGYREPAREVAKEAAEIGVATARIEPASGSDDRFLDYQESGHEATRLLRLVEFLGAPAQGAQLDFPLTAQDEEELRLSGIGADLEAGRYFCLHPGARKRDKCWPPHRFAEVGDRLCDEFGLRAVITGSAQEADLAQAVAAHMRNKPLPAAAPISIGAMAALMSRARLLICNDTGVSHIAAGLRLPSVVVFGKSNMERWAPLDAMLHRCVWDPEGQQTPAVVAHARLLLR